MSPTRRRTRRERPHGAQPVPIRAEPQRAAPGALPEWKWRTFPVYFALSLGLFIGIYIGFLTGLVADTNSTPSVVAFVVAALFLGFGLSRLTSRFMITRRWIKPRAKRR